jgi:serine/threonine protein kinase
MPPDKKKAGTGNIPASPEMNTVPATYQRQPSTATQIAVVIVASRYRLTLPVARVDCELASIERGPLHVSEAAIVIDEVSSALIAAHDKGIIHRDL